MSIAASGVLEGGAPRSVAAMDGLGGNCLWEEVVIALVARGRVFTFASTIHPPPIRRRRLPLGGGRHSLSK